MFVFAAFLLIGAVQAEAAQFTCRGTYFGYNFSVRGNTARTKIAGRINIVVTNSQGERQTASMTPTSSDIRPGQHIRFSGRGAKNSTGTVHAAYVSGTNYEGTLAATSDIGSVNVPVACRLTGRYLDIVDEFGELFLEDLPTPLE
jgi:hypothetical protein